MPFQRLGSPRNRLPRERQQHLSRTQRFCDRDRNRKGSKKRIVLGLVSTKRPALESKDALKRRIDEATKYVPLENLCISPQCGFASTYKGNPVTEQIQHDKMKLVVDVAREVWGTAA